MEKNRCCPLPATVFGFDDACALGRAYTTGEADPVAVAEACLEAAKADPATFLAVTEERALAEAAASRVRHAARRPLSPLDGVPIGWKDLFHVAGAVTTAGSALFRNNAPEREDCELALLAARAGMVCLGKLNTAEFAYSSVGYNPHYGTPLNPHGKPGRPLIPGGSSCGSGVAVAAGMIPLAMGSDTGGSTRVPATFNGVAGFKPSTGRYSAKGMLALARTLDAPGPLARSARDLAALDGILLGKTDRALPVAPSLNGLRCIVDEDVLNDERVQDSVRGNMNAALARLEAAGAVLVRRRVEPFHEAQILASRGWLLGPEALVELETVLDSEEKLAMLDPRVRKRIDGARSMSAAALVRAYRGRERLIAAMRDDLGRDVLLTPTVAFPPPPLQPLVEDMELFFHYNDVNNRLVRPGNVMSMPGMALPTGTDQDGAPTGMLLSGAHGNDETVLRMALAAEEAVTRK